MSQQPTTRVYVVLADAGTEHRGVELGLFFRVTDADAHAATLSPPTWSNARVEPRDLLLSDVHPAHVPCLSEEQQAEWKRLRDAAPKPVGGRPL